MITFKELYSNLEELKKVNLAQRRKQAIRMFRKKAFPNYNDLSISARVKADQVVMQRFGKKIDKMAKKQARKLKAAEPERVKKFRASQQATEK